jgi:hypothetical protein
LKEQLDNCLVKAPKDGMVVYANESGRRSDGPQIEEGASVREGQALIRLPDLTQMQVNVKVHESKVERLRRGLRAGIKIQDRRFQGSVISIANQPERTWFYSANIKEYATIVRIDGESSGLRPGMTAEVEILVANLEDVLSVPVQAVVQQGENFYCWVETPKGAERRPVVIGATNNTFIEIKDGVLEGDEVLLNPRTVMSEARREIETEQEDITARFGAVPEGDPKQSPPDNAVSDGDAPPHNFSQLDKDGDGKISRQEVSKRLRPHFDRIDANGDGTLCRTQACLSETQEKRHGRPRPMSWPLGSPVAGPAEAQVPRKSDSPKGLGTPSEARPARARIADSQRTKPQIESSSPWDGS